MNEETISDVMRELARRRNAKLTPERRSEIARIAGKAGKGIKKPRREKELAPASHKPLAPADQAD